MIDYDIRDFSTFQYSLFTAKNHHFFFFIFRDNLLTVNQFTIFVNSAFIWIAFWFVDWLPLKLSNVLSSVVSSAYMMGVNFALAMARSLYQEKERP